jgi:hypothetical protein
MTRVFWVITVGSIPAAFLLGLGFARWLAIGWLGLIGAWVSFGNWAIVVSNFRKNGASSLIPFLGGPLLALALAAFSLGRTSRLVTLGGLLDPWVFLMALWPLVAAARRLTGR